MCSLFFVSCNYLENKRKEELRNDSVEQVRIKFTKDSIIEAESIKHIYDSILKAGAQNANENNEIKRINKIKSTIRVTSCYLSKPNSASGCDANFYYINKSEKIIKYLVIDASFKNNVNDLVACNIRKENSFRGKDTGPVKPGKSSGGNWDCAIYNWSATKLVINSIDIDYMDGSSITIIGEELKLVGLKDNQINK